MTRDGTTGPVELAVIEFPGDRFDGRIAPALRELVDSGTIAILDLVLLRKGTDGSVTGVELVDLDKADSDWFADLDGEVGGLLSTRDLELLGAELAPGSIAAVLVWENTWARRLTTAVAGAGGRLVTHERVGAAEVRAAISLDG